MTFEPKCWKILLVEDGQRGFMKLEAKTFLKFPAMLKDLGKRWFSFFRSMIKNQDARKAYVKVTKIDNSLIKCISELSFFKNVNYFPNFGLITLIKKMIDRYYTMYSQILLSDVSMVSVKFRKRL